jgi:predicted DsbA family dithiol-disulfide isomerase
MKEEGEPILEHLAKKYGPSAAARFGDKNSQLMQAGRKVGIEFTNDRNVYPTVRAHALMEYVKEIDNDKANQLMEEMYKRYFEKGENINSPELLTDLAEQFGVERKTAVSVMMDGERQSEVLAKDQHAKRGMGVSGVPFYVIEQNSGGHPVAFSGAQPPDLIAEVLTEAAEE